MSYSTDEEELYLEINQKKIPLKKKLNRLNCLLIKMMMILILLIII
jgi:hypothetical protein